MLLLNPRRTRTNMKLLQLVWIFLLTLCGQSGITAMTVKEDDDVILDCSFGATNIENEPFTWKKDVDKSNEEVFWYSGGTTDPGKEFKDRVFHFPNQLRFGNASIKIEKAKPSDSGTYTCYHATVKKEIKSTISLTVGASSESSVRTVDETQNSALLQCEVRGAFPKPGVLWTDSDGNILDADKPKVTKTEENKYDTILRITVTKTDNYTCVATQKEINHQINSTTFVRLTEESNTDRSSREGFGVGTIVAVGVVVGVFGLLAVVAVHCFHIKKKSAGGSTPRPAASRQQQQRGNSLTDVQQHLATSA